MRGETEHERTKRLIKEMDNRESLRQQALASAEFQRRAREELRDRLSPEGYMVMFGNPDIEKPQGVIEAIDAR